MLFFDKFQRNTVNIIYQISRGSTRKVQGSQETVTGFTLQVLGFLFPYRFDHIGLVDRHLSL